MSIRSRSQDDNVTEINDKGLNKRTKTTNSEGVKENEPDEASNKFRLFKRFDVVKDYSDHYYATIKGSQSKEWTKAVQKEWRILEKDLPDTISVRIYEKRMDLLRAVIVGAKGTPYQDGLFFFDIYFSSNYPNDPPNVNYRSRGLHLNPNLYANGYVCLSLLNTWQGRKEEKWIPRKSTVLQVLLSIQALVLNDTPFVNEPGRECYGKNDPLCQAYNEEVYIRSCKTMLYVLQQPPKNFEDFVEGYFHEHAHDILKACKAYMGCAQVGCVGDVDESRKSAIYCSQKFKRSVAQMVKSLVPAFTKNGSKDCEQFIPPENSSIYKDDVGALSFSDISGPFSDAFDDEFADTDNEFYEGDSMLPYNSFTGFPPFNGGDSIVPDDHYHSIWSQNGGLNTLLGNKFSAFPFSDPLPGHGNLLENNIDVVPNPLYNGGYKVSPGNNFNMFPNGGGSMRPTNTYNGFPPPFPQGGQIELLPNSRLHHPAQLRPSFPIPFPQGGQIKLPPSTGHHYPAQLRPVFSAPNNFCSATSFANGGNNMLPSNNFSGYPYGGESNLPASNFNGFPTWLPNAGRGELLPNNSSGHINPAYNKLPAINFSSPTGFSSGGSNSMGGHIHPEHTSLPANNFSGPTGFSIGRNNMALPPATSLNGFANGLATSYSGYHTQPANNFNGYPTEQFIPFGRK